VRGRKEERDPSKYLRGREKTCKSRGKGKPGSGGGAIVLSKFAGVRRFCKGEHCHGMKNGDSQFTRGEPTLKKGGGRKKSVRELWNL